MRGKDLTGFTADRIQERVTSALATLCNNKCRRRDAEPLCPQNLTVLHKHRAVLVEVFGVALTV
jgi:hypothetical protein